MDINVNLKIFYKNQETSEITESIISYPDFMVGDFLRNTHLNNERNIGRGDYPIIFKVMKGEEIIFEWKEES